MPATEFHAAARRRPANPPSRTEGGGMAICLPAEPDENPVGFYTRFYTAGWDWLVRSGMD